MFHIEADEYLNVAPYGATCTASSKHPDITHGGNTDTFHCKNAIDGDDTKDWSANGNEHSATDAWITIKLPIQYDIKRISFLQRPVDKVEEVQIYFNNDQVHYLICTGM